MVQASLKARNTVRKPQHQAKAQSTTKTIVPAETRKLSINVPDRVVRPLYVSHCCLRAAYTKLG